jgi:hypothetical protein
MSADARREMGLRGRAKVTAEFDEALVVERYRQTLLALTGANVFEQRAKRPVAAGEQS